MNANNSPLDFRFQLLRSIRAVLLRLHKALLEFERVAYEQFYGRIQSKGELFQLVISHEWFSWLRPISQFIAYIDDILRAKEPLTVEGAKEVLEEARNLLSLLQDGTSSQRYYKAIQGDADIAFLHGELSNLLKMEVS